MPPQTIDMSSTAGKGRGRKRTLKDVDEQETNNNKKQKLEKVKHRSHRHVSGQTLTLGEGDVGQLGLGPDVMERTKPGKVDIPATVVQVCCGGMHTVCVTKDGEVYTFGCNDEGALGRKTEDEDDCSVPGKVTLNHKVVQVSAGDSHTAALTDEGKVFIWGTFRDANGSIGLTPEGKISQTPVELLEKEVIVKVSSGVDHLVCLTLEGDIYTVGNAQQGQLGRLAECFSERGGRKGIEALLTPAKVYFKKRHTKYSDIWTGQYVTYCEVKGTGEIFAWGLNNYYQLGFADMKNRFVPQLVKSFNKKTWKEIVGGQHHTVMLDTEGQVYCIGRREYGRLGLGEDVDEEAKVPTLVQSLKGKKCVSIGGGTAVSYAVTAKGELYAWGMGSSKQLGNQDEEDIWTPTQLTGKQLETRKVLSVSGGGQHTVVLAQDDS